MRRANEFLLIVFLFGVITVGCAEGNLELSSKENELVDQDSLAVAEPINIFDSLTIPAAERIELYLPLLTGKRVGIVGNQTSLIGSTHLVDSLKSLGVDIRVVFSPEHGFRGDHHAGAKVKHGVDEKTGIPIFSLHGKTKKPTVESLDSIDVILFDVQDVGARFYTYISSLHYVMEAAAENGRQVIVLDRPNPNAHYIDGPILQPEHQSFIGMHPVPVVYGMTIGEYGKMINGEFWMKDSVQANLKVIPVKNWTYTKEYVLPVAPSPNLPNQTSIYLYPSICFFEGTSFTCGRGTEFPFQTYGHPHYQDSTYSYTPIVIPGKSKYPKHENQLCFGKDLRSDSSSVLFNEIRSLDFSYLLDAKKKLKAGEVFFSRPDFFNLLAGSKVIIEAVKEGKTVEQFSELWKNDILEFKKTREKYLLYK